MKYTIAFFCTILCAFGCAVLRADDVQDETISEIRKVGTDYVEAFNAQDSKAVAAFWSPEAVYINRMTGEQVIGRDAIAAQFDTLFESAKDLKIKVDVESIDFVSPNVAVENGQSTFLASDDEPQMIPYSAVYIRREGKWLLDRVTDKPEQTVASHYEQLKPLQWIVGTWADESDSGQVVTECKWTKNQNFLTRSFTVSIGDRIELSGIQFIGWDPQAKQIRSWTFDSDGGYAQGKWSNSGDQWFIRKHGTTPDGESVTAVNVLTIVDDDAFTVKSTQRTIAGELLPNVDEIMVVRR